MKYCSIRFEMGQHDHEIWQALLGEWPFESFQDEESAVTGYIKEDLISPELKMYLTSNENLFFNNYSIAPVREQNWNAVWENSFTPIAIDDFCFIRASFHPMPGNKFKHVITIAPKMAFGTGHHATTFMMIRAMASINFDGLHVLDFGCGTGILSVVAAKEGAVRVVGVDIQKEAVENSHEHAKINRVEDICYFFNGQLENAPDSFDIILANIDRNTIIANLDAIHERMKPGSSLLVSGVMHADLGMLENALKTKPLDIIGCAEKEDWVQVTIRKP